MTACLYVCAHANVLVLTFRAAGCICLCNCVLPQEPACHTQHPANTQPTPIAFDSTLCCTQLLLLLFNAISFFKYWCHRAQCQQAADTVNTCDGVALVCAHMLHRCKHGGYAYQLRAKRALFSIYTLCHFEMLLCNTYTHIRTRSAFGCGIIKNCLPKTCACEQVSDAFCHYVLVHLSGPIPLERQLSCLSPLMQHAIISNYFSYWRVVKIFLNCFS